MTAHVSPDALPAGTPLGIPGHLLVGVHIARLAAEQGLPVKVPGILC